MTTLHATDRALANVDALLAGKSFNALTAEDDMPELPDDLAALDVDIAQAHPGDRKAKNEQGFKLLTAAELMQRPPLRWRVRGVLPEQGMAVIFGPSGSGKSFLVLDLAMSIAAGAEWFGKRVKAAPVLYCALEGEAGIAGRVSAYMATHGAIHGDVRFLLEPLSLLNPVDVDTLGRSIVRAGGGGGVVILDTLNRSAPGADENDSATMGGIIEASKRLQAAIGGLVLLVHHSGKDSTKGMRGHSSLHAALDAAIEVRRTGEQREWLIHKSKDGADAEGQFFKLKPVEIGHEPEDGEPITSCVIERIEGAGQVVRRAKVPTGGNQRIVFDVAGELLKQGRNLGKGGALASRPCVRLDELIAACRGRLAVEDDRIPERVRLAVTGLVAKGVFLMGEGWIWLP